ncbi:hypothetical protein CYMTET_2571 [Cymbomonas tetramitiformis]|uniref:Uncharacterized protein n=1 Tax=Cymbomonas tetramitiformis TaxID=36881 RepID=A0AAE0LLU0_9CHLO|nr:hypothetical protein CYMTET_2571 [Cymbomonas tetramitiformis]
MIMAWVSEHISELQVIPEKVRALTEVLIGTELFTVDAAGELALGAWPAVTGAWATRKTAEKVKFDEVSEWARAMLALSLPVLTAHLLVRRGALEPREAEGNLGIGTVASAAAVPSATPTHGPMDPQAIAAAIAAAVGAKLDALGERLATLEAQRSAAGGALGAEVHPFGKNPMKTLEAHAFDPLVHVLPELRTEECELDELPPSCEATVEHWHASVHLLQARVGEFQRLVNSQVPTFPISDVMVASFFKKRKRVTFEGEEAEARAAGGGRGALPPLDASRRGQLAALGEGFRTVNEEQLARALRGELAPEDVVRPPGEAPPLTAVPSRGPLAGIDLVISPVPRLQQEDEGRLKFKDGELTMVPKKKKCKDFAELERGILRVLCEAPAEARDDLVDFIEWARTIAAEFSFYQKKEKKNDSIITLSGLL